MEPRPPPEHQQIRERVATKPVRAVQAARDLAGGEEARHRRRAAVGVDAHAAHHIVTGRAHLHRIFRDIDVGELLELVVHRRQPLLDVVGGSARADVQKHPAVRAPPPRLDLRVDRTSHLVARQEVRRAAVVRLVRVPAVGFGLGVGRLGPEVLRDVPKHEALAQVVLERAPIPPHPLGDEDAAHRGRPDHAGRVELNELHVDQVGPRPQGQGVAVAGALPGVGRHLVGLAHAAGGEDRRLAPEDDEAPRLSPVPDGVDPGE